MTENDHDRNLWGLKMIMTLNDRDLNDRNSR